MKNFVAVMAVIVIVGLAVYYIIRQKKKGVKCIGCSAGGCCSSKGTGECTCNCDNNDK